MAGGKGFEAIVTNLSRGVGKVENGIRSVAYGKSNGDGGIKFPGNKNKTSGLIPILREINKIDLCNIINYVLRSLNLAGEGPIGKKFTSLRETAQSLLNLIDGGLLLNPQNANTQDVATLIQKLQTLNDDIDGDIVALFPKVQTYKNDITNLVGILTHYNAAVASYEILRKKAEDAANNSPDVPEGTPTVTELETMQRAAAISRGGVVTVDILNQIANEEVQKVLRTVQEIRRVLQLIISFTSVGDIASTLIPNEIKELQKIVSPTKLIPTLKVILNLAKGLNQIIQQVIGYVTIARIVVKVLKILIDVVRVAIWVFRVLPMPLMFATSGMMDALVWARQLLDNILDGAEKIVNQLGRVVDLIFNFFTLISQILEEVIQQIEILLFTLESCAGVDEAKAIRELKEVKAALLSTQDEVTRLTSNYTAALNNTNTKIYDGYTMEIQEEEVVEESVRYKRRRAVAFDYNGVLVEGTDLTFATDRTILFEELRLKLVNSGYIQDSGAIVPGLDFLNDVLEINTELPTTTDEIYASIGIVTQNGLDPQQLMKNEASEVKKQINAVIGNIKGGEDLRRTSEQSVQESNVKLKNSLSSGEANPALDQPITGGLSQKSQPAVNKGGTANPDRLSNTEVRRLQGIKQSAEESPDRENLTKTKTYTLAVEKLAADAKARKEENL